jgi:drug/metabolite transporter (DMT)-like permease
VACAVALGALSTAWAYLLYFDLIQRIGAARAMTVTLMVPAFGVLLGLFFLGEALSFSTVIGGALVLLGCVLALGGRSK